MSAAAAAEAEQAAQAQAQVCDSRSTSDDDDNDTQAPPTPAWPGAAIPATAWAAQTHQPAASPTRALSSSLHLHPPPHSRHTRQDSEAPPPPPPLVDDASPPSFLRQRSPTPPPPPAYLRMLSIPVAAPAPTYVDSDDETPPPPPDMPPPLPAYEWSDVEEGEDSEAEMAEQLQAQTRRPADRAQPPSALATSDPPSPTPPRPPFVGGMAELTLPASAVPTPPGPEENNGQRGGTALKPVPPPIPAQASALSARRVPPPVPAHLKLLTTSSDAPSECLSLSALSSQLSLHMELQSFARQRTESIRAAGGPPSSLLPQPAAADRAGVSGSASRAAALPPASRRRTGHSIRSVSLSLKRSQVVASILSDAAADTAVSSAGGEGMSDAQRLRKHRAQARAMRRRAEAEVLDLFGDGTAAPQQQEAWIAGLVPPLPLSRPWGGDARRTTPHSGPLASITEADAAARHGAPSTRSSVDGDSTGRLPYSLRQSILTTADNSAANSQRSSLTSVNRADVHSPGLKGAPLNDAINLLGEVGARENTSPAPSAVIDTDDLTHSFHPSPTHRASYFPFRRVLRAPVRATPCLSPPAPTASAEQMDVQLRMLTLLYDALQSTPGLEEFRTLCVENVRQENEVLRKRLQELRQTATPAPPVAAAIGVAPSRSPPPIPASLDSSLQQASLRRSLLALLPQARWNSALHAAQATVALALEETRLRCQLSNLPAGVHALSHTEHVSDAGGRNGSAGLSSGAKRHSGGGMPSPLQLASKSRRASGTPGSSTRELTTGMGSPLTSPSFSPDFLPSASASPPALALPSGGNAGQAQLYCFPITKINKLHRDTPRVLELDATTDTLTICKQQQGHQSPVVSGTPAEGNGRRSSGSSGIPAALADFANRDLVLSRGSVLSAELHPRHECQLDLTFHLPPGSTSRSRSGSNADGGGGEKDKHKSAKERLASSPSQSSATLKQWKVLFASREERERFHRLVHATLLRPDYGGGGGGGAAAAMNLALAMGAMPPRHPGRQASDGLQPDSNVHGRAAPTAVHVTPVVLQQLRVLPLLPLASALHTVYCLTKRQAGWKYGVKLEDSSSAAAGAASYSDWSVTSSPVLGGGSGSVSPALSSAKHGSPNMGALNRSPTPASPSLAAAPIRRTTPLLVPFHALPSWRRDYLIALVTQTLGCLLSLGFVVSRPSVGAVDTLDARARAQVTAQVQAQQGAATSNQLLLAATQHAQAAALQGPPSTQPHPVTFTSPSLGTLSPSLLPHLDLLASQLHDAWASMKRSRGYRHGAVLDERAQTHPFLVSFAKLPASQQEKVKRGVLRMLGTLLEWGYAIEREEAETGHTGSSAAASPASAVSASPIAMGSPPYAASAPTTPAKRMPPPVPPITPLTLAATPATPTSASRPLALQ